MSKLASIVFALSVASSTALFGAACKPAVEAQEPVAGTVVTADTLVLVMQAPPVGLRSTAEDNLDVTFKLDAGGQLIDMVQSRSERTRTEVLGVADDVASRVRVTYEHKAERRVMGPQVEDVVSPLAGKTFVVGVVGGTLAAVRLDGDREVPVTPEEEAAIAEDHKDLGKAKGMMKILDGRRMSRGERVALTAAEVALIKLDFADPDSEVLGGTVTFVGAEGGTATCRLTLDLDQGGLLMSLTSDLVIDTARTLPLSITASGTLAGTVPTPEGPMGVQGTLAGRQAYAYE
jgi:hypothetical protein